MTQMGEALSQHQAQTTKGTWEAEWVIHFNTTVWGQLLDPRHCFKGSSKLKNDTSIYPFSFLQRAPNMVRENMHTGRPGE